MASGVEAFGLSKGGLDYVSLNSAVLANGNYWINWFSNHAGLSMHVLNMAIVIPQVQFYL